MKVEEVYEVRKKFILLKYTIILYKIRKLRKINLDKLLSRCPYFFRLERILGDRPNVRPPVSYDSGHNASDTAATIEQLLVAMSNNDPEGEEGGELPIISQTDTGGEVGWLGESGEGMSRERDERGYREMGVEEGMRIGIGRNE